MWRQHVASEGRGPPGVSHVFTMCLQSSVEIIGTCATVGHSGVLLPYGADLQPAWQDWVTHAALEVRAAWQLHKMSGYLQRPPLPQVPCGPISKQKVEEVRGGIQTLQASQVW